MKKNDFFLPMAADEKFVIMKLERRLTLYQLSSSSRDKVRGFTEIQTRDVRSSPGRKLEVNLGQKSQFFFARFRAGSGCPGI